MSPEEATARDEEYAALLSAFDDALAGATLPPADGHAAALPPRLAEDLACLHLLHQLRAGPEPEKRSPEPGAENASEAGEHYSVLRLHAAGGIGQVWLVHDSELGRDVALKELRPDRVNDPAIVARFLREARITGRLQHPGIVPVYELVRGGRDDAEPPFYTMRFVQGRTLTDAARAYHANRAAGTARPLDQTVLLNAFINVCNTVAYAHSRGVIHRDLKGENVVLGDFGEVIVLDWGFAKELDQPEDEPASPSGADLSGPVAHTLAGQVLGTPAYMAPEQAVGRPDLIDSRTDVHGLGAILYEILTGRPPFTGDQTRELLQKVRDQEPPAPETVCPAAPAALAAVCRRALARDPALRYSTAADLGREVQHWLADEPVAAYSEPLKARLHRWTRHHKPTVAAAAVLLVTGLSALGAGTFLLQREQAQTAAVQARAQADKLTAQARARDTLEAQLYYHRIALAERERAANNLNRAVELLEACPERQRGWEWYCLQRLCHTDPLTIHGHIGAVSAVAFSPDGRVLYSAGHDHTVRFWDLRTAKTIRKLAGHTDVVYGLACSRDGLRLATASWDGTVKVWDTRDGTESFTCRGHDEAVLRVAFSPDSRLLVSLSAHAVIVWDAATGARLRLLGPVGGLNRYGLAFSPDGVHVAVTTHDPAVSLFDVFTGEETLTFRGHSSVVKNAAFSPDGLLVASGAGDIARSELGEVRVWETATGRELFRLSGHTEPIYGVAFSPDGRRLASASQDHTVKIWDLSAGMEVLTIRAHADTVRAVAFSPDGQRLATACVDGSIRVWDATPWADETPRYQIRALSGHGATVFAASFYPDGRHLAALSDNETIRTWDTDTGRELEHRRVSVEPQIYALAIRPEDGLLATATTDGCVYLVDPKTGAAKQTLRVPPCGPVKSLAFRPDGRQLAVAHWDRVIRVWDLPTGALVHTLRGHEDAVIGVAYSPDGTRIASASYDQTVRLWDSETGRAVHTLNKHTSRVYAVAFSPDGRVLASASNDATIRLWEPATGELLRTLVGHTAGVTALAFSPDGTRLASASNDWTVKLWDPATGTETATLRGHADRVHDVSFSPDGRRLASAGSDQTVRLWEVPAANASAPP